MSIFNKDEVEGKLDKAKGAVKSTVGDATDDTDLRAEGEADRASGAAQETWGKFKRGVGDAADAVGDAVKGD
jgi:uncharacterized protein YjbJ (UPF0337 family)